MGDKKEYTVKALVALITEKLLEHEDATVLEALANDILEMPVTYAGEGIYEEV